MIEHIKVSSNRRKKFQIITTIESRQNKKFSRKSAHTVEAQEYVASLLDSYRKLKTKTSKDTFELAPTRYEDESLVTDFIASPTIVTRFIREIRTKNLDAAHAILFDLIARIKLLPKKSNYTSSEQKKFIEIFGNSFAKDKRLIDFGYVDFNLDNIIIENNRYFLIDYEWIFDFPLPEDFIVCRLLYYSFLQASYKNYTPSELHTIDKALLTLPKASYIEFKDYFSRINDTVKTEASFQDYVGSQSVHEDIDDKGDRSELQRKLTVYQERVAQLETELLDSGERLNVANAEIAQYRQHISKLESTLIRKASRRLKNFYR